MKKLLSLLSVLTISGTAVPTTIAANPYQKEETIKNIDINYQQTNNLENLNREKRSNECPINEKYDPFGFNRSYYITLRPELVENILGNYSQNKIGKILFNSDFKNWNSINNDEKLRIVDAIYNHLSKVTYNEKWKNSNKKKSILLAFTKEPGFDLKFREYSESDSTATKILFNKGSCPNKYIDKLKNDFPDWNKKEINLVGPINENTDNDIKKALKEKYPNLIIENINIIEKEDYDPFVKNQSFKIETISTPDPYPAAGNLEKINYSIDKIETKFFYMSKTKIKELSDKIKNDPVMKLTLQHWKDYNLQGKIEEWRNLNPNKKLENWNSQKEIIKGYIRDFAIILKTIENQWKIDSLNNTIIGIKKDIDNLKNLFVNLENLNKINIPHSLSLSCANISTILAGAGGVATVFATSQIVPILGTIGGAAFTIIAGTCAVFSQ